MNHLDYLQNNIELFKYYKTLADRAIECLSLDQIYHEPAAGSNSIYVIMKHLAGNMRSRWRDFLTTDGEKDDRYRDSEFISDPIDRDALEQMWESGWTYLFNALEESNKVESSYLVYIRNEGHTIEQAVQRQLAHYAYHIGQIIYLSKMIQGEHFVSLSIPKGKSDRYNKKKFSKKKSTSFFTNKIDEK